MMRAVQGGHHLPRPRPARLRHVRLRRLAAACTRSTSRARSRIGRIVLPPAPACSARSACCSAELELKRDRAVPAPRPRRRRRRGGAALRGSSPRASLTRLGGARDAIAVPAPGRLRYFGQAFEITVPLPDGDFDGDGSRGAAPALRCRARDALRPRLRGPVPGRDRQPAPGRQPRPPQGARRIASLGSRRTPPRASGEAYFGAAIGMLAHAGLSTRSRLDADAAPGPARDRGIRGHGRRAARLRRRAATQIGNILIDLAAGTMESRCAATSTRSCSRS